MADLKEIVAETSRQMAQNSREIKEMQEKSDRESAKFRADMNKMQEKSDREFSKFQKEMKEGQNKLSLEMREDRKELSREMKEFKAEMQVWRDKKDEEIQEMRQERRQHNLEMGRIANKQGRMAEDFVAPSICRIMKEALGIDQQSVCIDYARVKRTFRGDRSKIREFDVIAECLDYVLVNETKTSPTPADVNELIESMGVIRDYFPEFKDRKLIGAIASLFLNTSLINYASAKGILALAVGDDLMDIKNPAGFKPSFW
jgi:hypothetical protein